jgi:hypothetical protein
MELLESVPSNLTAVRTLDDLDAAHKPVAVDVSEALKRVVSLTMLYLSVEPVANPFEPRIPSKEPMAQRPGDAGLVACCV